MKYSLLAIVLAAVTLSACEYKKHPMDKPPPSAMVDRDSAPDFSELDKETPDNASGATGDDAKQAPAQ
ncbi:MAG: hypothetical protein ABS69_10065 [Nitrosomonadales bacterium SCN 54-20]|nr:hypothetical protein [Nitrosospira multiformis]ODT76011.1 MAG: hypothetical protein ABS69_10065 [Nitrosomonadales bacterium SCN 54-20]